MFAHLEFTCIFSKVSLKCGLRGKYYSDIYFVVILEAAITSAYSLKVRVSLVISCGIQIPQRWRTRYLPQWHGRNWPLKCLFAWGRWEAWPSSTCKQIKLFLARMSFFIKNLLNILWKRSVRCSLCKVQLNNIRYMVNFDNLNYISRGMYYPSKVSMHI